MEIKIKREDGNDVNLDKLLAKILKNIEESKDNDAVVCVQESMRLSGRLKNSAPLVAALQVLIPNDLDKLLSIFFRAGYLLARAIDGNNLKIDIQKEGDDNTQPDSKTESTNTDTNSS